MADAILEVWYPGEEGGSAVADILFGNYNPSGRLPVTVVKGTEDLPPFDSYDMQGRTYRFLEKEPMYPFGYGLSYTRFEYRQARIFSLMFLSKIQENALARLWYRSISGMKRPV